MNVPHPAGFIKVDMIFTFYNKSIGNKRLIYIIR